ncbi:MAG: class I SAM-dependent methyltransferase, partial [Planctomycetaceae bacterium]
DHRHVNQVFVDEFLDAARRRQLGDGDFSVLDVGAGTAQIPVTLCARSDNWRVTAIDLAEHMLRVGQQNVATAGLEQRIQLESMDAKHMSYDDGHFDGVMSNSIIHHIPEPREALAEMWRVLRDGGLLFVRDLLRPRDDGTLESLVDQYAGDENAHQKKMFRESLHAALTLEEMAGLLSDCGLPASWVRQTTDRHWTICNV